MMRGMTIEDSEFLSTAKVAKWQRERIDLFLKYVLPHCRRLSIEDSDKTMLPVLWFETKNKGDDLRITDILFGWGDTGKIGSFWGNIYLYRTYQKYDGHPVRFRTDKDRVLTYDPVGLMKEFQKVAKDDSTEDIAILAQKVGF